MNNKTISIYHYEKKGLLLSLVLLIALAIINRLVSVPPALLPANNAWLIALLCVAAVVMAFVIAMYKKVTVLKQHLKNKND